MQLPDDELLTTAVALIAQTVKAQDEEFFDPAAHEKAVDVQSLLLTLPLAGAPTDVDHNVQVLLAHVARLAAWGLRGLQRTHSDFDAQAWLETLSPAVQALNAQEGPA